MCLIRDENHIIDFDFRISTANTLQSSFGCKPDPLMCKCFNELKPSFSCTNFVVKLDTILLNPTICSVK